MSLDLSILEIAADIVDETGRGPIAEQVRELKGRIERLVKRIRAAEEQKRRLETEYPSNLVLRPYSFVRFGDTTK